MDDERTIDTIMDFARYIKECNKRNEGNCIYRRVLGGCHWIVFKDMACGDSCSFFINGLYTYYGHRRRICELFKFVIKRLGTEFTREHVESILWVYEGDKYGR